MKIYNNKNMNIMTVLYYLF